SPVGAQGMNTGIQDAWNLAWKLALVVSGQRAPCTARFLRGGALASRAPAAPVHRSPIHPVHAGHLGRAARHMVPARRGRTGTTSTTAHLRVEPATCVHLSFGIA